jgi:hypothetical protein
MQGLSTLVGIFPAKAFCFRDVFGNPQNYGACPRKNEHG